MKQVKAFFIMSMIAFALFMAQNIANAEEVVENEDDNEEEEVPAIQDDSNSTDIRGVSRFLLSKKSPKPLKCNKNPRICRAKQSPGPDCCKRKCVDVMKDRMNCGVCGKKCKYSEECCRGKCVNLAFDKKHCGRCNKKCSKGDFCVHGLCNYA